MREYKIFFEIFGKKLVTTVTASSPLQAKAMVREAINFYKVEDITPTPDSIRGFSDKDISDFFGGMFK